ncbi:hypothetical protein [Phyllobacterium sp. OV277]|uniref:AEC family transporter n=1 Tax=Phyllobacterium sp. OV277 TaxID=1882772 RepID=UPI000882B05B|nr:hypothetical protein [Phyllobacterium sp. OV277]SDP05505.1 Predicted permease [Phyllobacterium sp. OV277]
MLEIVLNLLAFYLILALGAYLRRYLNPGLQKQSGVFLVRYALPMVFFISALRIHDHGLLSVSLLSLLSSLLVFGSIAVLRRGDPDGIALGTMSSWSNNAFLGIPLASILFGSRGTEIASLWASGSITFFSLVSAIFFTEGSGGHQGWLLAFLRKIIFPPYIPAFLAGFALSQFGFVPSPVLSSILWFASQAIFVLSVLYVGSCLKLQGDIFRSKLILHALLFKHALFPLLAGFLLFLDAAVLGSFSEADYPAILFMSVMPVAINVVILFQGRAELQSQAAFSVTVSTLITILMSVAFLAYKVA